MSFVERSVLGDPALTAALPPGERARAWTAAAQVTQGAVRGGPYGSAPPPPERQTLLDVLSGGGYLPRWARGDRPDRFLGGIAVWGGNRSLAAGLHDALDRADGLVVTDGSLVAVRQDVTGSGRTFSAVWTCRRTDLVAARRRGRLVGRGRVELFFADRSMAAVVTGVLRTNGARRLLAALELPSSPPGADR